MCMQRRETEEKRSQNKTKKDKKRKQRRSEWWRKVEGDEPVTIHSLLLMLGNLNDCCLKVLGISLTALYCTKRSIALKPHLSQKTYMYVCVYRSCLCKHELIRLSLQLHTLLDAIVRLCSFGTLDFTLITVWFYVMPKLPTQ